MFPEEIAMRKARFSEHQIIAVLKSVEAGRTVRDQSGRHVGTVHFFEHRNDFTGVLINGKQVSVTHVFSPKR